MTVALVALPSSGALFVSVFLGTLFAMFGYRLSVRNQLLRGVTPWKLPSFAWAIICLLIGPIGIVVELIANFTTRPDPDRVMAPHLASSQPGGFATMPAPQYPATAASVPSVPMTVAASSGHASPPSNEPGKTALFGWYPDVTRRHELRYWDGKGWTALVSDGGVVSNNPL